MPLRGTERRSSVLTTATGPCRRTKSGLEKGAPCKTTNPRAETPARPVQKLSGRRPPTAGTCSRLGSEAGSVFHPWPGRDRAEQRGGGSAGLARIWGRLGPAPCLSQVTAGPRFQGGTRRPLLQLGLLKTAPSLTSVDEPADRWPSAFTTRRCARQLRPRRSAPSGLASPLQAMAGPGRAVRAHRSHLPHTAGKRPSLPTHCSLPSSPPTPPLCRPAQGTLRSGLT